MMGFEMVIEVDRSVVTLPDGFLALVIKRNGIVYAVLKSEIKPKTRAEIKDFCGNVLGAPQTYRDDDFKPMNQGT